MELSHIFIDFFGAGLAQLLFTYLLTTVLDIPNKKLFWALELPLLLIAIPLRSFYGYGLRAVLSAMCAMVVPFVLSRGKWTVRLVIVFLSSVVLTLAELPAVFLWMLLTGQDSVSYEILAGNLPAFGIMSLAHWAILIAFMAVERKLIQRYTKQQAEALSTQVQLLLVCFPLVQMTLLFFDMFLLVNFDIVTAPTFICMTLLTVFCLVADLFFFNVIYAYAEKEAVSRKVQAMESQLEAYIRQLQPSIAAVKNVARLRHDARNQVQTAVQLSKQGKRTQAIEHLDRFLEDMDHASNAV